MRLLHALVLALAFLALFGCLGNNTPASAPVNNTSSAPANLSTTPAVTPLEDRPFYIFDPTYCSGPACDAVLNRTTAYMGGQTQLAEKLGKTTITLRDCFKLDDNYTKITCISIAATRLNDSKACEYAYLLDDSWANGCFSNFAVQTHQPAACDQINVSSSSSAGDYTLVLRAQCHLDLGVITADPALCRKGGQEMAQALGPYASSADTSYSPTQDWCMREAAIQRKDASLCANLDSDDKTWCEYRIAHPAARPEYCNEDISLAISHLSQGKAVRAIAQMDDGANLLSWWDYGYGVDCAGLHSLISSNHSNPDLILKVAYLYTQGSVKELADFMRAHNAKYVMFDSEIVGNFEPTGFQFGSKYSALNYLGCNWVHQTNADNIPSRSQCEMDNQPEQMIIPLSATEGRSCIISESTQSQGIVANRIHLVAASDGRQPRVDSQPIYCVRQITGTNGQPQLDVYMLDQRNASGDLVHSPAFFWSPQPSTQPPFYSSSQDQAIFAALYQPGPWTDVNGTNRSAWDYRVGQYYDSPLYQGFFLNHLEGFDLAYETPNSTVRVFKLK